MSIFAKLGGILLSEEREAIREEVISDKLLVTFHYQLSLCKEGIMRSHKDLDVWKRSIRFVQDLYSVTKLFPKDEIYCLTNQMRRAAVSIPSNIAEGAARKGNKEFIHYLYISLGSLSELETQIIISERLKYIDVEVSNELTVELIEIKNMILGLIRFLSK